MTNTTEELGIATAHLRAPMSRTVQGNHPHTAAAWALRGAVLHLANTPHARNHDLGNCVYSAASSVSRLLATLQRS